MKAAAIAWRLLKETLEEWYDDGASKLAAALAFYTVFSLAPMLVIVVAITGAVVGKDAAEGEILMHFRGFLGAEGARLVRAVLEEAGRRSSLATILGTVTLLFGATVVFVNLQEALNTIWGVAVKPGRTVKMFFRKRLLSFVMVLLVGILILALLVASTALSLIAHFLRTKLPVAGIPLRWLEFPFSFAVITVLFGLIYRFVPDVRIKWSNVWIGAAATALLFNAGKLFISFYLANTTTASPYGAASSLMVFLLWIYYSAQVFFLGAEFTQVYSRFRGSLIEPGGNSVRVSKTLHLD